MLGNPSEQKAFFERNPAFVPVLSNIDRLSVDIFQPNVRYELKSKHQLVCYALLVPVQEIFLEILLLASNGYGRGAQSRLRTMYEFVAVAAYLQKNDVLAAKFIKYQLVERRKELQAVVSLYTDSSNPDQMKDLGQITKKIAELDIKIDSAVKTFGKRFIRDWHDGLKTITKDLKWEHHYFYDYLIPNRHVHASSRELEQRMSLDPDFTIDGGPDYAATDEALRGALTLKVLALGVMDDVFSLQRGKCIHKLAQELETLYKGIPNKTQI